MTKNDKVNIWKEVLESIRVSVSPAIFSTWLIQTQLEELKEIEQRYIAQIGCASTFVKSTVEQRYFGLLQDSLTKILEKPVDLVFEVSQNSFASTLKEKEILAPLFEETDKGNQTLLKSLSEKRIRADFTFQNFAVSTSNQMAWAATEAVSKNPGKAYNPLFIWGGVGVGKTHLMHAVAINYIKSSPEANIVVCTGEEFTNGIVEAIRNKNTPSFRNKYRKVDMLLIDDIQFIAGKDAVQDEFFHTFNALTSAGGQIIMTSDKPPSEIAKLEERLKSRFEAGLIVDIAPPDFELRCAIIQIKAVQKGLNLDTESVHFIAGNTDTARKIEGLLIKIISETKLKGIEITPGLIKSLLGKKTGGETGPTNTIDDFIKAVCTHFSITKKALFGKTRARLIAYPRQILMYLLRMELELPLEEIGRILGGRDHSTIIHGVDKIISLTSNNVQIREDIMRIKNSL